MDQQVQAMCGQQVPGDTFRNLQVQRAYQGRSFTLGASIGVVMLDTGMANVTEVLHAADMACYAAKRAGRNRVVEHAQKASAV